MFMCLKEYHSVCLDRVLTGKLGLPSLQNYEHVDQNTRIFHRNLCIATNRGKGGATLELNVLLSVSSTYHAFLLKILSASEALPQQKLSLHMKPTPCVVKYTVSPHGHDLVFVNQKMKF